MKGQYEQHCNAAALKSLGVPCIKSLKAKHLDFVQAWVNNGEPVEVDYPDRTEEIIDCILADFTKYTNKAVPNYWNNKTSKDRLALDINEGRY